MRRHADREAARTQAALTEQRDQAKDDAASTRSRAIVGLIMGTLGWSLAVPS